MSDKTIFIIKAIPVFVAIALVLYIISLRVISIIGQLDDEQPTPSQFRDDVNHRN